MQSIKDLSGAELDEYAFKQFGAKRYQGFLCMDSDEEFRKQLARLQSEIKTEHFFISFKDQDCLSGAGTVVAYNRRTVLIMIDSKDSEAFNSLFDYDYLLIDSSWDELWLENEDKKYWAVEPKNIIGEENQKRAQELITKATTLLYIVVR